MINFTFRNLDRLDRNLGLAKRISSKNLDRESEKYRAMIWIKQNCLANTCKPKEEKEKKKNFGQHLAKLLYICMDRKFAPHEFPNTHKCVAS
jgi:hypothetical protein